MARSDMATDELGPTEIACINSAIDLSREDVWPEEDVRYRNCLVVRLALEVGVYGRQWTALRCGDVKPVGDRVLYLLNGVHRLPTGEASKLPVAVSGVVARLCHEWLARHPHPDPDEPLIVPCGEERYWDGGSKHRVLTRIAEVCCLGPVGWQDLRTALSPEQRLLLAEPEQTAVSSYDPVPAPLEHLSSPQSRQEHWLRELVALTDPRREDIWPERRERLHNCALVRLVLETGAEVSEMRELRRTALERLAEGFVVMHRPEGAREYRLAPDTANLISEYISEHPPEPPDGKLFFPDTTEYEAACEQVEVLRTLSTRLGTRLRWWRLAQMHRANVLLRWPELWEPSDEAAHAPMNLPLDVLGLDVRTLNSLRRAKVEVVGDLYGFGTDRLLGTRNFGQSSLSAVFEQLYEMGYPALPSAPESGLRAEDVPVRFEHTPRGRNLLSRAAEVYLMGADPLDKAWLDQHAVTPAERASLARTVGQLLADHLRSGNRGRRGLLPGGAVERGVDG